MRNYLYPFLRLVIPLVFFAGGGYLFGLTTLEDKIPLWLFLILFVGLVFLARDIYDWQKEKEYKERYQKSSSYNNHDSRIIRCPSCKKKIRVKMPLQGNKGKCVACSSSFSIKFDEYGNLKADKAKTAAMPQAGMELSEYTLGKTEIRAILQWNAKVNLDIHAFFRLKDGSEDGHVFFPRWGSKKKPPYIHWDQEYLLQMESAKKQEIITMRTLALANIDKILKADSFKKQEIITIKTLANIDNILIATNIFRFFGFLAKDDNFAKYDGKLKLITSASNEIDVPLTSSTSGRWCVIALIDNSAPCSPMVTNINKVTDKEPKINDYLDDNVLELTYEY